MVKIAIQQPKFNAPNVFFLVALQEKDTKILALSFYRPMNTTVLRRYF